MLQSQWMQGCNLGLNGFSPPRYQLSGNSEEEFHEYEADQWHFDLSQVVAQCKIALS